MSAGNTNEDSNNARGNFNWQNRVLLSLGKIISGGPTAGLATEVTLQQVLLALQSASEYEVLLVSDTGNANLVVRQVVTYDTESGTLNPPVYYRLDGTPYTPIGPLAYIAGGTVTNDGTFATPALQTTGNTSLNSINTKIPALGQALAAASVPVVLTAAQLTALTPLTSVAVTQATGTNLHTVIDSGSVTANAGTNLNTSLLALESGGNLAASVTVLGTTGDAIIAAGGSGSISAKMRRATQGLEDLKSLIVLAAGTNVIGKVGIDQTTSGTTNAVFPLATENHIGSVTGIISTVTGSITRPNDTNTYAAGDEISNATSGATIMSISGCARVNNGSGRILSAQMVDSANQALKLDGDLFLFDTTVAMQGDNVAFAPSDAELVTCVGVVSFTGASCKVGTVTSGAGGNAIYPNSVSGVLPFTCIGGGTTLYGKFVARNAFIPVANEVFTFRLVIDQY
jgi:hypothetical protein